MRNFLLGIVCGLVLASFSVGIALHRNSFRDVPNNRWYTDAVNELASIGVFDGYPDGSFKPGKSVNRAELAVALQKFLRHIEKSESSSQNNPSPSPSPSTSTSTSTSTSSSSSSSAAPVSFQSTANPTYSTPLSQSLNFTTLRLSTSAGAIFSNLGTGYTASSTEGVNHEVTSESYGLIFNALSLASEQQLFDRYYQFFKQYILSNRNLAYWKLREDLTPVDRANATIDDLKIIKGLLRGYERFSVAAYRDTALAMANAMKQYGVRNNILVSHITWDSNGAYPANHLILGYADFEAMRMLAQYDSAWNTILTSTLAIVRGGQTSNGLFKDKYRFDNAQYESESSLHSIFQAYTIEHLATAGNVEAIASARTGLNFFKNEFAQKGRIFGRYNANGTAAVSYEDLASYAILARAAVALGETQFAAQLMGKILSLQIGNVSSPVYGAFLWSSNEAVYAFVQLNSLYTVALFRTTSIQPATPPQPQQSSSSSSSNVGTSTATPGPAPTITAQNYVVWHMSDIYYGPHHNEDFTTMVNDMDTLAWNDAVIAGDISGNGSVENFTAMKGIVTGQSSHPWSVFNFLAGNHEYNCGATPIEGCLNNYKNIINPNLRYTFDRGNIHFVVMSTDGRNYRMSDDTMAWFRNEVAANQDKIIIPLTHHMPHVLGDTTPRAQTILDELNIDIWLFGHAHCKHGDASCTRHGAYGDFYQQAETTFVDAGYIGNMESRYLIFTEGSNQVRILSRNHERGIFQSEFEHTATLRYAFRR